MQFILNYFNDLKVILNIYYYIKYLYKHVYTILIISGYNGSVITPLLLVMYSTNSIKV